MNLRIVGFLFGRSGHPHWHDVGEGLTPPNFPPTMLAIPDPCPLRSVSLSLLDWHVSCVLTPKNLDFAQSQPRTFSDLQDHLVPKFIATYCGVSTARILGNDGVIRQLSSGNFRAFGASRSGGSNHVQHGSSVIRYQVYKLLSHRSSNWDHM